MIAFLSDEWLAEMARLVAEASSLRDATQQLDSPEDFAVAQHITDVPPTDVPPTDGSSANTSHNVDYYIKFGLGPASVHPESVDENLPHVSFTQSYATAVAIATGELSAQSAFMAGQLRVGGRVDLLTANVSIMENLDDVLGELRAKTRW